MIAVCDRCGIGVRVPGGACDWCAAPARARVPLLIAGRRRLLQSRLAAALRRRGPGVTGLVVGVALNLAAAGIGVAAGVSGLWQVGFFWSLQWWWSLTPDLAQPWLFGATKGAFYGMLAAIIWESRSNASRRARELAAPGARARQWRVLAGILSPACWTGLIALAVSLADTGLGTQYSLIAALLGAAVGRSVTLLRRGCGGGEPAHHGLNPTVVES